MKKPWPGTMIAAVTITWIIVGGMAVVALGGMWFGGSMMGGDTESHPIIAGLGQVVGSMILAWSLGLVIPTLALCIVSILVQGRRPWSKIAYSVVAVGLGAVMITAHSGSPMNITSMGWLVVPVIVAAVLMWMPYSRPFFVRQHRDEQVPSIENSFQEGAENSPQEPLLVEDWPPDIVLPSFDDSPQQSDSGFQRVRPNVPTHRA